jgi:predicted RNA-binding Zn-ribbon protein involved in translation (DUF1610 family)
MNEFLNVVIVISRCSPSRQSFGIRVEERLPGQWVGNWAFAIKEAVAKKEGYVSSEVRGSFEFDSEYPGCPHCGASSIFKCGMCNKIGCWDAEVRVVTCPWCGKTDELAGHIESFIVGGDY